MSLQGKAEGGLDQIVYVDESTYSNKDAVLQPDEVLVKVEYSGLNPVDYKVLAGEIPVFKVSFPHVLGRDFYGTIERIGSNVTNFNIGDPVFGMLSTFSRGTHQKYLIASVKDDAITKCPPEIAPEVAATATLAALTSLHMIDATTIRDTPDQNIVVLGASGGVGNILVQFIKQLAPTANIIALCSPKNFDMVLKNGATHVVDYKQDYKKEVASKLPEGKSIDVVMDCVGGDDYYQELYSLMARKTDYVTIVGPVMHAEDAMKFSNIMKYGWRLIGRLIFSPVKYKLIMEKLNVSYITKVEELMRNVRYPTQVFDVKQGQNAYEALKSHHTQGKIALHHP